MRNRDAVFRRWCLVLEISIGLQRNSRWRVVGDCKDDCCGASSAIERFLVHVDFVGCASARCSEWVALDSAAYEHGFF